MDHPQTNFYGDLNQSSLLSLKVVSYILISSSFLAIIGPVVGEIAATLPPILLPGLSQNAKDLGIPYEDVSFPTSGNITLKGWFFALEDFEAPTVIYAPATSKDQRSGLTLVPTLHEAGYQVLLFSYRGHGTSEGNPFQFTYGAKESEDIDAAVRYLSEKKGIKKIAAIGHSAGAVSILLSAARNPGIDAVVAVAAFASLEEIWETSRPTIIPKTLLDLTMRISELRKGFDRNQVRPMDVIGKIAPRPLLLIHGSEDQRITKNQVDQLFNAAEGPKYLWHVAGAGHDEVRSPGLDQLMPKIIGFLNQALNVTAAPVNPNL